MRICCLSDYHSQHAGISADEFTPHDITVFTGDWTGPRNPAKALSATAHFLKWLSQLPSKRQIIIAGNHDGTPYLYPEWFAEELALYPSITYLHNESITIDGHTIYGSPYTPPFFDWFFMKSEHELAAIYKHIPPETTILLTHGPAFEILDETDRGVSAGSYALKAAIASLSKLQLHAFGHIHEAYGQKQCDNYIAVNASSLDYKYAYENPPIYITLKDLV